MPSDFRCIEKQAGRDPRTDFFLLINYLFFFFLFNENRQAFAEQPWLNIIIINIFHATMNKAGHSYWHNLRSA